MMMGRPVRAKLSRRDRDVLDYVVRHIEIHGYSPSIREIVAGTQLTSTSSTRYCLERLADRGYINRAEGIARGITLPA